MENRGLWLLHQQHYRDKDPPQRRNASLHAFVIIAEERLLAIKRYLRSGSDSVRDDGRNHSLVMQEREGTGEKDEHHALLSAREVQAQLRHKVPAVQDVRSQQGRSHEQGGVFGTQPA